MLAGSFVLSVGGASASCGGTVPTPAPEVACRVGLPPRPARAADAPPEPRPPIFLAPRSTVIVNVDVPFKSLAEALDAKIARRVAEERDHDLGMAGRLQYVVDRGAFVARVDGDALVIEAPLQAHVQACAKGSCYAGCDPEARATVRVPLALSVDYKFRPSSVHIDITRGCELRALGGLLRVDVTPIVEQRLAAETRRIETSIDSELPNLRPHVERVWTELGRARSLPLGACVELAPDGVVQGPSAAVGESARLRFGIYARPELRSRCGDVATPPPLPPLKEDRALPVESDVHLGLVLALEAPAIALEGAAVDLGAAHGRVAHASGPAAEMVIVLTGETCGALGVRATQLSWATNGRALHLGGVALSAGDSERVAGAQLDPAAFVRSLQEAPIASPTSSEDLRTSLPALASMASDARMLVTAAITDARPESAGFRNDDPIALIRLRGAVTIRANDLR